MKTLEDQRLLLPRIKSWRIHHQTGNGHKLAIAGLWHKVYRYGGAGNTGPGPRNNAANIRTPGARVATSAMAFQVVKGRGVANLVRPGIQPWKAPARPLAAVQAAAAEVSARSMILRGSMINAVKSKDTVFMAEGALPSVFGWVG